MAASVPPGAAHMTAWFRAAAPLGEGRVYRLEPRVTGQDSPMCCRIDFGGTTRSMYIRLLRQLPVAQLC